MKKIAETASPNCIAASISYCIFTIFPTTATLVATAPVIKSRVTIGTSIYHDSNNHGMFMYSTLHKHLKYDLNIHCIHPNM